MCIYLSFNQSIYFYNIHIYLSRSLSLYIYIKFALSKQTKRGSLRTLLLLLPAAASRAALLFHALLPSLPHRVPHPLRCRR